MPSHHQGLSTIPRWLSRGVPRKAPASEVLTASRTEMYQALQLFYSHVKYVITVMTSIVAATIAILGLTEKFGLSFFPVWREIAGRILCVAVPTSALFAIIVIYRYYDVYLSALLFATRLHLHPSVWRTQGRHPWFERAVRQACRWRSVRSDRGFIFRRAFLAPCYSFVQYALLIVLLAAFSVYTGRRILSIAGDGAPTMRRPSVTTSVERPATTAAQAWLDGAGRSA